MRNTKSRMVIVGLDGMPFHLIRDLAQSGVMPNTGEIMQNGAFAQMESSIPEISSVAWSSVITGANPGQHGIFGFTDVPDGTYRLSFPSFSSLKMPPFWNHQGNGRSVIINVPFTYPASTLDGVLIAGFVALDLKRATYPPSLISKLNELDYRIDVDSEKAHRSMDLFLKDLDRTLQARIAAYRHLWDKEDWQTFMLVFTGTDRLAHFLWQAYEDESHKYHSAFMQHLHEIDKVIGEIRDRMGENDSFLMLSDHGFELSELEVQINVFLLQEGFLKFTNDPPRSLADIDYGTRAFALDPARIYINLEGKYPRGSVKAEERDAVITELRNSFESLEVDGRKVVRRVFLKEEIYHGPYLDHAPDMVLLSNKGIDLKASLKAKQLSGKDVFTGKHSQEDAFLLIDKPLANIIPKNLSVSDVLGVMNRLKEAV